MQVAIISDYERNATEMHGRAHGANKTRGDSFFPMLSTPNLGVSSLNSSFMLPTDLLERVGAGMSFRPRQLPPWPAMAR